MKPIDAKGFEEMFRAGIDPWGYRTSAFEGFKRRVLLHACGDRTFGRAVELACAIGETSHALAPRCLRLLAIDSSRTAIRYAVKHHGRTPRLRFAEAELPAQMPSGPFDLIVVSELVYYLSLRALRDLLRRLTRATAPGGRIVVLHHLVPFADAAQLPALAQRRTLACLKRTFAPVHRYRTGRFEAVTMQRRVGIGGSPRNHN